MATANFTIEPEDGWVAVTAGNVDFIRIRSNTPQNPFFVTSSSTAPAASATGFKVDCYNPDFYVDVLDTGALYYVRAIEGYPNGTRIDVFFVPSA